MTPDNLKLSVSAARTLLRPEHPRGQPPDPQTLNLRPIIFNLRAPTKLLTRVFGFSGLCLYKAWGYGVYHSRAYGVLRFVGCTMLCPHKACRLSSCCDVSFIWGVRN